MLHFKNYIVKIKWV